MSKRCLMLLVAMALGLGAAVGCTDLSYNCAGICGTELGNGDFEGTVDANTYLEALAACEEKAGCDAGFTPTCTCYLVE